MPADGQKYIREVIRTTIKSFELHMIQVCRLYIQVKKHIMCYGILNIRTTLYIANTLVFLGKSYNNIFKLKTLYT